MTRAGAAGLAVRARGRGGAVTVTVGTVTRRCGLRCGRRRLRRGLRRPVERAFPTPAEWSVEASRTELAASATTATPVKQSSTSAELLRRSKRLVRIDMTAPQSLTGTTRPPRDRRITAKRRRAGCRRGRRWREGVPAPDRCQAVGGARAANSARCGDGEVEGERPARLASGRKRPAAARMAARQGPRRRRDGSGCRSDSGRPRDRLGLSGSAGVTCAAFDASAPATVNLSCRDAAPQPIEMHVAERQRELERERKQRQVRTPSRP